jgi:ribosomal protein S6E (S10)
VASRKEQKERLRAERVAKEEADRSETSRRRRMQIGAAAGGLAIIGIVVAVIVLASGGGTSSETSSGGLPIHKDSVPADSQLALLDTPPPWKPNYKQLQPRVEAMGLPGFNETTFHIHAHLEIFVDGKQVPVPANIGIDEATGFLSPLHTHPTGPDNPAGTIHMEADQQYDFTVGQFMNVWGVKFSDTQIGSLKSKGAEQLQVYVNGQLAKDPVDTVMQEHDVIVIGYGKPGSFPQNPKFNWPQGL